MEGKGAVGTYPGGLDCSTSPVMRLRYAVARWEAKCSPMTTSDPDAALVLMQGPIGRCSAVTMYLGSHFARQKARSVLLNIPAYDEHGDDAALTMQPVPRSLSKPWSPLHAASHLTRLPLESSTLVFRRAAVCFCVGRLGEIHNQSHLLQCRRKVRLKEIIHMRKEEGPER